jgi:hypothetical protein
VVFEALSDIGWPSSITDRLGRSYSTFVDLATQVMTTPNHHDWLKEVADGLKISGLELWRVMVSTWINDCLSQGECNYIVEPIQEILEQT